MNTIELTDQVVVPFDSEHQTYKTKVHEFTRFNEWDVDSLIDLVVNGYHSNTRKNIAVIYDLAQKVFCRHSEKHSELPKLVETLFLFFDDLLFHLKKEEQILFPNIIQLAEKRLHEGTFNYSTFGVIKEYTLSMQAEHRDVVRQLQFLRRLTNDYRPPEDCSKSYQTLFAKMKAFENEMILHIQLENDFLFPKAIQMDEKLTEKEK